MLAIGTCDGIVMLESKNAAWEVAERALPGARVEGVCSTASGTIVATDQGIFESSDSTGGWRKTLDGVDARSLAVTTDGIVFVGANNAMLYRRRPSEEHFTEVTSFRELPTCASWTFPVLRICRTSAPWWRRRRCPVVCTLEWRSAGSC